MSNLVKQARLVLYDYLTKEGFVLSGPRHGTVKKMILAIIDAESVMVREKNSRLEEDNKKLREEVKKLNQDIKKLASMPRPPKKKKEQHIATFKNPDFFP